MWTFIMKTNSRRKGFSLLIGWSYYDDVTIAKENTHSRRGVSSKQETSSLQKGYLIPVKPVYHW